MKTKRIINIIFLITICLLLTGCMEESKEKRKITAMARNYLHDKYGIEKKQYKIEINSFRSKNKTCLAACGENRMKIKYNNDYYNVYYDYDNDTFNDDLQYEQIIKDLTNEFYNIFGKSTQIEISAKKTNMDYYDGTNLESMINRLSLKAFYNNNKNYNEKTISKLKDFHDTYGGSINLIYFTNEKEFDYYWLNNSRATTIDMNGYSNFYRYIDFILSINKEEEPKKYTSSKIKLNDEFIAADWELPTDIKFEQTQPFDLNAIEGYDSSTYSIISNYYRVYSDTIDLTHRAFHILYADDRTIQNMAYAMKKIDRNGNITYEFNDIAWTDRLNITKYNNYKEISFVLLEKK